MAQWYSDKWCFTINAPANSTESEAMKFLGPIADEIKLRGWAKLIFQFERGEMGTYHIQGVLDLGRKMRMNAVKSLLHPTAHLEKCRNWMASVNYCSKEETRLPNSMGFQRGSREDGRTWPEWTVPDPVINWCVTGKHIIEPGRKKCDCIQLYDWVGWEGNKQDNIVDLFDLLDEVMMP